jgi:hypothetical protein
MIYQTTLPKEEVPQLLSIFILPNMMIRYILKLSLPILLPQSTILATQRDQCVMMTLIMMPLLMQLWRRSELRL